MSTHTHTPERVSRVLVEGEVFRALTCGTCGALYGHTPWPVTARKGAFVAPTSKPSDPVAAAGARAAMAEALRPLGGSR